ncbi:hypothetical protein GCM10010413_15040 [Promicromonospora sukumoe]
MHGMFVALIEILDVLGEERVAGLTILRGSVRIEPSRLSDGVVMARELGLTEGVVHRLATPAVADWSGTVAGLECHVRSLAGAVR